MAIRTLLSSAVVAVGLVAATAAHAGKDTVPGAIDVFTPAAAVTVSAAIEAVRSGDATFSVNPDGSITVSFNDGTVLTFTSRFIAGVIASYS